MTKNIYIIFDKISKTYTTPFFEINNEKVNRDIINLIKSDPKSELGMNYKDKIIYLIGTYNESTGTINLLENKEIINDLTKLNIE